MRHSVGDHHTATGLPSLQTPGHRSQRRLRTPTTAGLVSAPRHPMMMPSPAETPRAPVAERDGFLRKERSRALPPERAGAVLWEPPSAQSLTTSNSAAVWLPQRKTASADHAHSTATCLPSGAAPRNVLPTAKRCCVASTVSTLARFSFVPWTGPHLSG